MPVKLLNWNVEWAAPKWKAAELQRRIDQQVADIICLTETDTARLALPQDGHSICAQADYGQPFRRGQEGRRKVLLWSKEPWDPVDDVGLASLPPGRFVSGVTRTDLGEVAVIGVCIPWSRSRVNQTWNRKMWQDHEEYLDGLAGFAEAGSQNAPRRGGRFQPADRAAQFNAAAPSCRAPVGCGAQPVDCHRRPGLSGKTNHRPHRVEQ